jgi:transcriptional regulator with GAF, ATPase, and Fis domain
LHLNESSKAALDNNNLIAYCIAEITLAYAELRHDRIRESYARASWCLRRLAGAGIIPRQYPAPFLLEMLQAYHQRGYEPLPFFDFPTEVAKLLTGPNVHLKGVALRISAAKTADDASPLALALLESEACLKRSGDRVELAKTRCEMARCMLRAGDQDAAREQALKASEGLSGLNLFPDDLVWILDGIRPGVDFRSDMTDRLFEMMENFLPNRQTTDYLGLMLDATSRFFKAERAGLFWFEQKSSKAPVLRSGKNLTGEEVSTEGFREQLALIFRSLHENRVHRIHHAGMPAVLCIPLEVEGKVQAVIYHDNTYLDDCFDFLDDHTLMRLKRTLGTYLEKIIDDERRHTESEQRIPARLVSNVEISNDDILTQDERMLRELSLLDQVAASDATALISGETGVGKELFAHRIHRHSPRQGGPFIVVDLASLPESLVESELFGHEKGSFTGADAQRIGKIELADKGTLFIDELGEIPRSVQVKLLRALQEKSVMRLGGSRLIASDFRLVAATNRNLSEEVKAGRFREDLYYRINVVPIEVPPLRERGEDIVFIARRFMATAARQFNRIAPDLTRQDEQMLMDYQWPGNVRELKNVIERAVLLSSGDRLELMLSAYTAAPVQNPFADKPGLEEVQRRYIMYVLETTGGRISGPGGAAEILGMPRTTLNARMKKLGLR